jgi:hypothetical protein
LKISPRLLWFLIALLVASNVVTAVTAVYLLGRLDLAYSEIVNPALEGLGNLRELTRQSANAQRAVLNLLMAADPEEMQLQQQRYTTAVQLNRQLLDRLGQTDFEGVDNVVEKALGEAGASYLACADKVFQLVGAGRKAEARMLRMTELRTSFEAFQSAQIRMARGVSDHAVSTSSSLTTSVNGLRRLLLAAASLPLLGLSALGLAFLVFVFLLYRILSRLKSSE